MLWDRHQHVSTKLHSIAKTKKMLGHSLLLVQIEHILTAALSENDASTKRSQCPKFRYHSLAIHDFINIWPDLGGYGRISCILLDMARFGRKWEDMVEIV